MEGKQAITENKIFKPRPSIGWIWVALIALVLLATGFGLMVTLGPSGAFLITILHGQELSL